MFAYDNTKKQINNSAFYTYFLKKQYSDQNFGKKFIRRQKDQEVFLSDKTNS